MKLNSVLRAVRFACLALMAAFAFTATTANTVEARTASERATPRAEIWRGYGEMGYQLKLKQRRTATVRSTKKSFRAAVKTSGYKTKTAYKKSTGKKYAALNYGLNDASPPRQSATGGGVRWAASSSCLNGTLVALVQSVAATYGPVTVSSTCRSHGHNASVGGAKRSQHLTGDAVDFRVHGNYGGVYAFLRSNAGGVHHYGGGLFHADTGPRRTW